MVSPGPFLVSFSTWTMLSDPSPMYFAADYVSFRTWWKAGFVVSVVNLTVWSTIGFAWWKVIGIW